MHKKKFLSNRDPQVSLNKLLRMSLIVSVVALAGATGMRGQDPD